MIATRVGRLAALSTPADMLRRLCHENRAGAQSPDVWGMSRCRRLYRAVQFQATGRSKTRPLRRSAANVIGQRKPMPHKPLQPIRPLDSKWLEPAAHGVEVARNW